MPDNVLNPGDGRIGWLYDDDESTPHLAVMLQDTGEQIVMSVPFRDMGSQHARWFAQGINYGDDPHRTKFAYEPPQQLMFQDPGGQVVLVGCKSDGFSAMAFSAGVGRIVPNHVVLGARNLRYDTLNGLRSEIPWLSGWAGMTSRKESFKTKKGRVDRLDVRMESPPAIKLDRTLNFTMRPTWSAASPNEEGVIATRDIVEFETTISRPRPWEDHLIPHLRMRELLVVSAWHRFGFTRISVNRTDDPETALSGKTYGERWSDALSYRLPEHRERQQPPRFLFTYNDIGATGVRRWLRMSASFERAIQPLIFVADNPGSFKSQILQTGIAFEALGHQLGVEAGKSPTHQVSFMPALDRVLSDLKFNPLPDPEDWKKRCRASYMGVKHPDRGVPHSLVLANTLRDNLLVLRFWIAGRLGVKRAVLERRLSLDPVAHWAFR
ncbi:MAG: hypothetical protein WED83_10155 [Acidimicrobiia bacterium]